MLKSSAVDKSTPALFLSDSILLRNSPIVGVFVFIDLDEEN